MIDSVVTFTQARRASSKTTGAARWLLLIHQIPPRPDYLRVKVRRRLQRVGALPLKNSVYVLPANDESREDFEWLWREIVADGGDAVLCEAAVVAGTSDDALERQFRRDRGARYRVLTDRARALVQQAASPDRDRRSRAGEAARLKHRLEEIVSIDHFDAPERAAAERALEALAASVDTGHGPPSTADNGRPRNAIWVTRQGAKVDRIASAWLIRRFIDPGARFRFVPAGEARSYRLGAGELRFDMYQGEYTHQGDWCTFETLLAHFPPAGRAAARALEALAEIVHDIDLKETRFERPETAGVAAMIAGIVATTDDDLTRLERGAVMLDDLFSSLGGTRAVP